MRLPIAILLALVLATAGMAHAATWSVHTQSKAYWAVFSPLYPAGEDANYWKSAEECTDYIKRLNDSYALHEKAVREGLAEPYHVEPPHGNLTCTFVEDPNILSAPELAQRKAPEGKAVGWWVYESRDKGATWQRVPGFAQEVAPGKWIQHGDFENGRFESGRYQT